MCATMQRFCLTSRQQTQVVSMRRPLFPAGLLLPPSLPFSLELIELSREAGFSDGPVSWVERPALG